MGFKRPVKPIRTVVRWQVTVTAALTVVAALVWGRDGAISAALGGAINIVAGWVYGWRAAQGEARTAGEALRTILRAEAIKVLLIIVGLGLVLTNYREIVHVAFFASFVITVGVFAAAIAVPDTDEKNASRG
ncbi:MAG TPA: ATP synthase subunit I [Usitatibacter sp.]|jgi:ATP synthase protein I|nr:ATP synthase subunit I [Usitatibacter sp.]